MSRTLVTLDFKQFHLCLGTRLFDNINNFRRHYELTNQRSPLVLDLTWPLSQWPVGKASQDVIYCCNVLHMTPWPCSLTLFCGSAWILRPGGLLLVYDTFSVDGVLTPDNNVQFNLSLRLRNPDWGIRDVADLKQLANQVGLQWVRSYEMPADNKILVFRQKDSQTDSSSSPK